MTPVTDMSLDNPDEPLEVPPSARPPDEPWLAGMRSLGEALIDIAELAPIPLALPPGVVRGLLPKEFKAEGAARGWTVAAIYQGSDFQMLAGFISPKGVRFPLYDWPECRDRTMLLEWMPQG